MRARLQVSCFVSACLAFKSGITYDALFEQGLRQVGLLETGDSLDFAALISRFCQDILIYHHNLAAAGFGTDTLSPIHEEAMRIFRMLRLSVISKDALKSSSDQLLVRQLDRLAHLARSAFLVSADYAVLWLNTLLGANIFALALLMKPGKIVSCVQHLLEERGSVQFRMADPIVISKDNDLSVGECPLND